jgi:DNA-binding CsgD family transcriptional regulator
MDRRRAEAQSIQAVIRLCHAGLDLSAFKVEVIKRLRTLIPIDASCVATADPATLLFTGVTADDLLAPVMAQFLVNEFLQDDVNKLSALARSSVPVGGLSAATQQRLTQSARYRDILADLALGDELRAALVVGGACWGFLGLYREQRSPDFTLSDAAMLALLAPHLAHGLRTALLRRAVTAPPLPDTPGVLLLAEDLTVVATTAAAERWLTELGDQEWPRGYALPPAVFAVATRLLAVERCGAARGALLPRARLRTASGQWLVLHAARLAGLASRNQIAVIFEVARSAAIVPLIVQAYALSPREAEIVQLVAGGRKTTEIAAQLHIATTTVQDHLKAIFTKVGVHSRGELVGQLITAHYQPRIEAGTPLDTDGWFT